MRITLFFFTLVAFQSVIIAQRADTIIDKGIYKSYYSNSIRQPLYVTYTLFRGGGDCDRNAEHFSFHDCGVVTGTDQDYRGSKFDKGHLANAEDFAGNCTNEELTFCYYNCVPQTARLNRGAWKTWETKARTMSQDRKLFIVAGAIYSSHTIGVNKIGVPDYCYKIILDSHSKKILYCLLFPNDNSRTATPLTLRALKKILHYPLVPYKVQ